MVSMSVVRFTKQRQAILEVMRHTDIHPEASWVYAEVRKVLPQISLGTVYRSLEALVEDGYLMAIQSVGDARRYDVKHPQHHHLVCKKCGKIFDIPTEHLPQFKIPAQHLPAGFEVQDVLLEFHGVCQTCSLEGN